MAKIEQMLRLKYIEHFLRSRKNLGASYDEIYNFLQQKFADKDFPEEQLKFTPRTFQRDKEALARMFDTEIVYRRSTNTYAIDTSTEGELEEDVFDNLLLVEAFREIEGRRDIMFFENRRSRGLHLLNGLVHAIANRKIITLKYTKFWEGTPHRKVLEPYALKEFKHRWYLLANERDGESFFLKTLGLDRITDLEISASSFRMHDCDLHQAFVNSFGIISTMNETAQDIVLSFDAEQGNYVKTLPLHNTQEILVDSPEEVRLRVRLSPTYDFEREILSHGDRVKVLSPPEFRQRLQAEVRRMLKSYE